MRTQRHVSSHWLLLALSAGILLFLFITMANEIKTKPHVTINRPIANRFQSLPVDDLSTPLNTRFEDMRTDGFCLNALTLNTDTNETDWEQARNFLDGHFYSDAGNMELSLRTLLSEDPNSTVISLCRFSEELYALRQMETGDEFAAYSLAKIANPSITTTPFILPLGRVLEMRTNIFEDDALFISARQGDASYTAWYYFKFNPAQNGLEQVEWCDRWYGGGNSPYGNEPNLMCEYTYAF